MATASLIGPALLISIIFGILVSLGILISVGRSISLLSIKTSPDITTSSGFPAISIFFIASVSSEIIFFSV